MHTKNTKFEPNEQTKRNQWQKRRILKQIFIFQAISKWTDNHAWDTHTQGTHTHTEHIHKEHTQGTHTHGTHNVSNLKEKIAHTLWQGIHTLCGKNYFVKSNEQIQTQTQRTQNSK